VFNHLLSNEVITYGLIVIDVCIMTKKLAAKNCPESQITTGHFLQGLNIINQKKYYWNSVFTILASAKLNKYSRSQNCPCRHDKKYTYGI